MEGIFIGIPENRKGYIVIEHGNLCRVMTSCDVTFFERLDRPKCVRIQVSEDSNRPEATLTKSNKSKVEESNKEEEEQKDSEGEEVNGESKPKEDKSADIEVPVNLQRSKCTKQTPTWDDNPRFSITAYSKKLSGKTKELRETALTAKDPMTYEEAMLRSDANHWKRACVDELQEFVRQKLFSVVLTPTGRKVVGYKWVFKTKLDMEGQIEWYKARLVTQGFSQIPGVDFDETFAPVTCHQTLWMLLALANRHDWHVHQMDVKSAFLNRDLDNEIFMKIPPGAEEKHREVWLLHKVLYGLKQASREWYLKLKSQLEGLGFKRSDVNHGVFTKNVKGRLLVIAVYVDDFLLFLSSIEDIKTVKSDLKMCFDMKDLDEAK